MIIFLSIYVANAKVNIININCSNNNIPEFYLPGYT